jgi:hypothetical protein
LDGPERPEFDTAERVWPEWPQGSWRLGSPPVLVPGPVLGWRVGSWGEVNDAGGVVLVDCRRSPRVDGLDGPGTDNVAGSRGLPEAADGPGTESEAGFSGLPEAVDGPGPDGEGGFQDSREAVSDGWGE